jgi:hypothetical protein
MRIIEWIVDRMENNPKFKFLVFLIAVVGGAAVLVAWIYSLVHVLIERCR